MLGKLLKYEVKAAGKVMPALYLGIGLSYLLGKLTEALPHPSDEKLFVTRWLLTRKISVK